MNNKKLLLIPVGLLFFVLLIFTSSGYNDSKVLFVFRHTAIFLGFVFTVVIGQIYIKNKLIRKGISEEKRNTVKVLVGVFGVILLLVLSSLQIRFITEVEISNPITCDYYDELGNIIYISKGKSCATLESSYINEDTSKYSFKEIVGNEFGEEIFYTEITMKFGEYDIVVDVKEEVIIERYEHGNIEGTTYQKFEQNFEYNTTETTLAQKYYQKNNLGDEYVMVLERVYRTVIEPFDYGDALLSFDPLNEKYSFVIYEEKRDNEEAVYNVREVLVGEFFYIRLSGSPEIVGNNMKYSLPKYFANSTVYIVSTHDFTEPSEYNISTKASDTFISLYDALSYIKYDEFFIGSSYRANLDDSHDNNYVYDIEQIKDNTYKGLKKIFMLEKTDGLLRVTTKNIETVGGIIIDDSDLIGRQTFSEYDFYQQMIDLTISEDYFIHQNNPLLDYLFILHNGGEFIEE